MGHNRPRPRAQSWRVAAPCALLWALALCGCAHRDVVDTPVGWWHQLQGGAIAQQRPPPPGVNDPYPHIGTTPEHPPQVASLDLRRSVTSALLRQRNRTTRLDADDPIPPAVPRPIPHAAAPGPSSATLDAAEAPAQQGPASAAGAHDASAAGAHDASAAGGHATDSDPELAMPAVVLQAADGQGAVTLPAIPGAPPPPPVLPGLSIASGTPRPEAAPDYRVAPPEGTQIAFAPGTDSLLRGQQSALQAIASRRGAGTITVHGYGDANSADPQAQAQAVSMASLRARAVAQALLSEGVPASAILLRAEAFGRGASVTLVN